MFLKMPKIVPVLTDTACKQAKHTDKPRRLFDGKQIGLHLLIQPSGAKLWRLRYTFGNDEKRIALGKYPEVTLDEARQKAADIKSSIKQGIDPSAIQKPVIEHTFEFVALKFVAWKESVLLRSGATIRKYNECLNNDLLPALGGMDIKSIHVSEIVPVLERIEKRSNSLARKNQELISMIIKYAIQRGYRPPYTQPDLSGIVIRKASKPKTIPTDIPQSFKKIDKYEEEVMRYAMRLQFLCFLRSSETMGATWDEVDFKKKEWHIEKSRMKMRRPHVVPLSTQAIRLLKKLKTITGDTPYLFPSKNCDSHLVRDALSKAFRSCGLGIVPHGCRTAAGTWMRNAGYAPHLIESQLSHVEENEVAAAYQNQPHLMYLKERHVMIQAWSNHLSESAK